MIHIYTGDGKGKTTAAAGSAIRCIGAGKRVLFCQFLKDGSSGECQILKALPKICCLLPERAFGFTFQMDETTRKEARIYYSAYWDTIWENMQNEHYDMIILDEICAVSESHLVEVDKVVDFLDSYGKSTEIILTGRNPLKAFMDKADYITEMKKIRHPFDQGFPAREGIEY